MRSAASLFLSISLIAGCIIPKEARVMKRETREWRGSPIVLHAWADTPFSGIFLTLRENKKFEHTTSGMVQYFEAGTWSKSHDTITLKYEDITKKTTHQQNVIIDKATSTLKFEADTTPIALRLRILTNKFE